MADTQQQVEALIQKVGNLEQQINRLTRSIWGLLGAGFVLIVGGVVVIVLCWFTGAGVNGNLRFVAAILSGLLLTIFGVYLFVYNSKLQLEMQNIDQHKAPGAVANGLNERVRILEERNNIVRQLFDSCIAIMARSTPNGVMIVTQGGEAKEVTLSRKSIETIVSEVKGVLQEKSEQENSGNRAEP